MINDIRKLAYSIFKECILSLAANYWPPFISLRIHTLSHCICLDPAFDVFLSEFNIHVNGPYKTGVSEFVIFLHSSHVISLYSFCATPFNGCVLNFVIPSNNTISDILIEISHSDLNTFSCELHWIIFPVIEISSFTQTISTPFSPSHPWLSPH